MCLSFMELSGQNWQVKKAAATISFTITNAGAAVDGTFDSFEANNAIDPQQPETGSLYGKIAIKSIKTGIAMRDRHLMKKDYFHQAAHPSLTFQSTQISPTPKGYIAEGNLTIKGITKKIQLPFTFVDQRFEASTVIKRADFDIAKGSWFLGEEVTITLSLPVTLAAK